MSGDLDELSSALRNFVASEKSQIDLSSSIRVYYAALTACPEIAIPLYPESELADLMKLFDQLVKNWMASLPLTVSNPARLAKFRVVRQIAIELCLSSLGISIRNKAHLPSEAHAGGLDKGALDIQKSDGAAQDSLPSLSSSQVAFTTGEPDFDLPTPARTPSVYSQATTASDVQEIVAISRLRQYAVSIGAKLDPGAPHVLSRWPTFPGADPAAYEWVRESREADNEGTGDEREARNKKEEAKRRRRTEKFLQKERSQAASSASQLTSQPMVLLPGSQPEVSHYGFSSQVEEDVPMTQPDRGVFGSRTAQKRNKGKKKHKAGF